MYEVTTNLIKLSDQFENDFIQYSAINKIQLKGILWSLYNAYHTIYSILPNFFSVQF